VDIIEEIAELTAQRKLLPFLGAGCSKAALNCDWDSIIQDMKVKVTVSDMGHLNIAQAYVDEYGKDGLCQFLKQYLHVSFFDETKNYCHISIMCSGAHVIYTTNQDNVMEHCMKHFGRKFRSVIRLSDLIDSYPDECLYIKFHGDLSVPESVVFTTEDYQGRMQEQNNFLDIRLRADLLGRQLLFVGYSFRDPNIQDLFIRLQEIAGGSLPSSYLIAYSATDSFKRDCEAYNIKVVVPQELFPGLSTQIAFETFLTEWNRLTFEKFTLNDVHDIFHPSREVCIRMLAPIECKLLEETLPGMSVIEAIRKFRGLVDAANIPASIQERIANVFFSLCQRCKTEEEADNLNGASFNLRLTDPKLVFMQAAHVLALANVFKRHGLISLYYVTMPNGFPEHIGVLIGATSIELLVKWNRPISAYFQEVLLNIADYSNSYDSFGDQATTYCSKQYNFAWSQHKTTLENPLKRQKRLNAPLKKFVETDYNKIKKDMLQTLPFEFI
jgi:hypothetical protein